ncbi:16127_t:CDS:2 [Racocetra fulgida]|uniref:16127_t:CDS:1 n=1 Tax=Racocetra fulgida TaxID=60492 RepID=A0A9N9HLL6_9GLOM|nr:16127_t:CDS:2 [Racocetra fulgida]
MKQKLEAKNYEHMKEKIRLRDEHMEEIIRLRDKHKDDEAELVARTADVLKLRKICNVRSALELREPADFLLESLNKDPEFKKCLEETCDMNNVHIEAVKKCIGGLYHTPTTEFHGHDKVVVSAKDWAVNEIIALEFTESLKI